jgi:outer membrane immunogenic protein
MDRILPNVTGGWAYGRVYADFVSCAVTCVAHTKSGWTAFEWAFAPNWSAKVEYLHVDLGSFAAAHPFVGSFGLVAKFKCAAA